MTNHDLIRALDRVPETRPRILELAWRCVGPDGEVDLERCAPLLAEIEAAGQQVQAYIKQTERLKWALIRLLAGR